MSHYENQGHGKVSHCANEGEGLRVTMTTRVRAGESSPQRGSGKVTMRMRGGSICHRGNKGPGR